MSYTITSSRKYHIRISNLWHMPLVRWCRWCKEEYLILKKDGGGMMVRKRVKVNCVILDGSAMRKCFLLSPWCSHVESLGSWVCYVLFWLIWSTWNTLLLSLPCMASEVFVRVTYCIVCKFNMRSFCINNPTYLSVKANRKIKTTLYLYEGLVQPTTVK